MRSSFPRLAAVALVITLAASLSLFAEFRAEKRTDMQQLASDLERALGKDHVDVEGAPRPRNTVAADDEFQAYIDAMNRERMARGLVPLRANHALALAAADRVRDMMAKHYFAHVAPDGLQPFVWVDREGYDYRAVGENLAVGYRGPDAVVDGWMHSDGHRANILNKAFEEIGVAVAPASPARGFSGPLVVALYGCR